ncbi:bifunctional S-adenosyl-L-methionine-dependent methyltransferase superfamily/tRNA methyltransferase [Babesia duncani]|uniref:tRNA (guanine(26)-N(2))-dimethyltransferase n=1 Tax=Babesia duncani TaxID=323732 RepID=A0AAD9PIY9_9APIC|nr:bifunctional S-adenosyl-L-methionine-dependent methyltransferase superfamily/tRNA methyltransferase [Babesia duncani]
MEQSDPNQIVEGLVAVNGSTKDGVKLFYNPPQVFNRDLSLIVLKAFIELSIHEHEQHAKEKEPQGVFVGVNILEMFAATGIRSVRYIKELAPGMVNYVFVNDMDRDSAESIPLNLHANGIDHTKFRAICADANNLAHILTPPADILRLMLMNYSIQKIPCGYKPFKPLSVMEQYNKRIEAMLNLFAVSPPSADVTEYRNIVDVIDMDPYSSASGFLDAAVACVKSGGILFVTSTDMPTLCGNNPLVSFYKYGGSSIKAPFCHEMSLRTLLYAIATSAARYQRIIEPLVSCSADFYVRVFVRIKYNPMECKRLASNAGLVLMCRQCDGYTIQRLGEYSDPKQNPTSLDKNIQGTCAECGGRIKIGGPIYLGKLHDADFVSRCLEIAKDTETQLPGITTSKKIIGILTSISEEIESEDAVLYYKIPQLCKRWNLTTLSPVVFKNALEKLGYITSHFHRDPQTLKTNAPLKAIMDIIRTHAKSEGKQINHGFFQREIETQGIDLSPPQTIKKTNVARWILNPQRNWGPKKMHRAVASSFNAVYPNENVKQE